MANSESWFIHSGTAQEGPFNEEVLQQKLSEGKIHSDTFIWKEGMSEWLPLRDVLFFQPTLEVTQEVVKPSPALPQAAVPEPLESLENAPHEGDLIQEPPQPKSSRKLIALIAVGLFFGVIAAEAYLNRDTLNRMLLPYLSPIPKLADVSEGDLAELRAAVAADLKAKGPQTAWIKSQASVTHPVFFVSSNLGENVSFDMYFEADPLSLLDIAIVQKHLTVGLQKFLGRVDLGQIQPRFPIGSYTVFLSDPQKKTVMKRSYFLGGIKTASYDSELKNYHDKLRAAALQELERDQQFSEKLEKAIATIDEFVRISKQPLPQENPKTKTRVKGKKANQKKTNQKLLAAQLAARKQAQADAGAAFNDLGQFFNQLQPTLNGKFLYPLIATSLQNEMTSFTTLAGQAASSQVVDPTLEKSLSASILADRQQIMKDKSLYLKAEYVPVEEILNSTSASTPAPTH